MKCQAAKCLLSRALAILIAQSTHMRLPNPIILADAEAHIKFLAGLWQA
jgi:hypothetical protein